MKRPMPHDGDSIESVLAVSDEDTLDAASVKEKIDNPDGRYALEDQEAIKRKQSEARDETYPERIQNTLIELKSKSDKYLTPEALETYSPKFLEMLKILQDDKKYKGLHLIYSQFRTLEGIGILKLILEANGFAQFSIKEEKNEIGETEWALNIPPEDIGKPMFALYTGTEEVEEKELVRNIFNNNWGDIPKNLRDQISEIAPNNILGQLIKVLMITSSGAEGIDLQNVRYVHITEPYWHPVRTQQVIGRARRICSHRELPEKDEDGTKLRTVEVFIYLMTFTEKQLSGELSKELRLKDKSKRDGKTPLTSDEALYEISQIKEEINSQILTNVKETAIDCSIHKQSGSKERLTCLSFGSKDTDKFSYEPDIESEESDTMSNVNTKTIKWTAKTVKIDKSGKEYALNPETLEVYTIESYREAARTPGVDPDMIGKLIKVGKSYKFEPI